MAAGLLRRRDDSALHPLRNQRNIRDNATGPHHSRRTVQPHQHTAQLRAVQPAPGRLTEDTVPTEPPRPPDPRIHPTIGRTDQCSAFSSTQRERPSPSSASPGRRTGWGRGANRSGVGYQPASAIDGADLNVEHRNLADLAPVI